jgi:hypothetical protein
MCSYHLQCSSSIACVHLGIDSQDVILQEIVVGWCEVILQEVKYKRSGCMWLEIVVGWCEVILQEVTEKRSGCM